MIIMALDHTRDFFGAPGSPTNLATASVALFFTRWITNICRSFSCSLERAPFSHCANEPSPSCHDSSSRAASGSFFWTLSSSAAWPFSSTDYHTPPPPAKLCKVFQRWKISLDFGGIAAQTLA